MAVQGVRTARFSDFEEFAGSFPATSLTATPLRAGAFRAETTCLGLGEIMLATGCITPLMALGGLAPDTAHILLPLRGRETLLLNGRTIGPHDIAVYGAGAVHDGANPADTSWARVTLAAESVHALLSPPRRSPIFRPGAHVMLRTDPEAWARVALLVREVAEVAAKDPEVFEVEEARRSLRASVLDAARELLEGPWGGAPPRLLRASRERGRIVRLVEDHLRADPGRPTGTADLCAALGLSPSRLRSAVTATFGMSPQRYLRLRRLAMARSALRSGDPRWRSVREVALAHGFWHLERFARAYRDMFGEAPSATFGRAIGRGGKVDSGEDRMLAHMR
jgi:AraC family ethanolamine operon transcriptional activator